MKRQPIESAAAFFVLRFLQGEITSSIAETEDKLLSLTDGIFQDSPLY